MTLKNSPKDNVCHFWGSKRPNPWQKFVYTIFESWFGYFKPICKTYPNFKKWRCKMVTDNDDKTTTITASTSSSRKKLPKSIFVVFRFRNNRSSFKTYENVCWQNQKKEKGYNLFWGKLAWQIFRFSNDEWQFKTKRMDWLPRRQHSSHTISISMENQKNGSKGFFKTRLEYSQEKKHRYFKRYMWFYDWNFSGVVLNILSQSIYKGD